MEVYHCDYHIGNQLCHWCWSPPMVVQPRPWCQSIIKWVSNDKQHFGRLLQSSWSTNTLVDGFGISHSLPTTLGNLIPIQQFLGEQCLYNSIYLLDARCLQMPWVDLPAHQPKLTITTSVTENTQTEWLGVLFQCELSPAESKRERGEQQFLWNHPGSIEVVAISQDPPKDEKNDLVRVKRSIPAEFSYTQHDTYDSSPFWGRIYT